MAPNIKLRLSAASAQPVPASAYDQARYAGHEQQHAGDQEEVEQHGVRQKSGRGLIRQLKVPLLRFQTTYESLEFRHAGTREEMRERIQNVLANGRNYD